ncbi:MAG: hypothetical protein Q4E88_01555 [Coriobacteriia bacterium]|nr:hypothetical protein [Coriobacteriia bacterium]
MSKLQKTQKEELENVSGGNSNSITKYYVKCTACSKRLSYPAKQRITAENHLKNILEYEKKYSKTHSNHLDKIIIVEEHC